MTGAELIAREWRWQVEAEGWSPGHDDQHTDGSLPLVAIHYAAPQGAYIMRRDPRVGEIVPVWPYSWSRQEDKKPRIGRIHQLAIAGACLAAEIDRLRRYYARAVEILSSALAAGEEGRALGVYDLCPVGEHLLKQGRLELRDGGLWITDRGRAALPKLQAEMEEG